MNLKNNLIISFCLLSIFAFSQKKEKKVIKEEYIERTSSSNDKYRWFNTFNKTNERISKGSWEYSKDSTTFIKKYTNRVYTEKERKLEYHYNKDKKVVTKTEIFKKEDKVGQFTGFIKNHECFMYDNEGRKNKTVYYKTTIDTTDSGYEQMNEDYNAYLNGKKSINTEFIVYNFKPTISKKFNKKGQLEREVVFKDGEGFDYFYDEDGNLESYSKFEIKYGREIQSWEFKEIDLEYEIFQNYNLEGEYAVEYKFDEFGNWIEETTLKDGYFHSKKTRHLVYY